MKVKQIAYDVNYPYSDGIRRFVYELCNGLSQYCETELITSKKNQAFLPFLLRLKRKKLEGIIHSHLPNIPFVKFLSSASFHTVHGYPKLGKLAFLEIKKFEQIIVPSLNMKNLLIEYGIESTVIPYGISTYKTQYSVKDKTENILSLLYLGHFYKGKGVEVLLDAIKDLYDIKLTIAWSGRGNINRVLKKIKTLKIKDRVKVVGIQRDTRAFMLKHDAIVIPADSWFSTTALPFTAIEAFSASVPVICSEMREWQEILPYCSTFEKGNSDDLKELLFNMNQKKLALLSRKSKAAHEKFNIRRVVAEHLELYRS
ncbi:hypothetical protein DRN74_05100 [Candidatus Micrarchaeota archaeon]|nr:MAG: hypothetical protein DRN74_05100 [Candidatus Micrarchaeota archaeon]